MPVKPLPGESVEETKVTRIIPAAGGSDDKTPRKPFWDFIEGLSVPDWKNQNIVVHLYRGNRADRGVWCGKYQEGPFSHEVVQRSFGGGTYNAMVKKDGMLIYNEDFGIVGTPKESSETQAATGSAPASEVGQILQFLVKQNEMFMMELKNSRGGDTAEAAIKQALALNGQIFSSAAGTVAQTAQNLANGGGAHAPNPMDDLTKEFMRAMMLKMMSPESNSIDTTLKLIAALKESGLVGSAGGGGHTGIGATLASMAPQIIGGIRDTLGNMARLREMELQAVIVNRGGPTPQLPQPHPVNVSPQPQPQVVRPTLVNPQPQQPAEPAATGLGFFEFIEGGILNILSDPTKPLDHAANETLIFLDSSGAANFVDTMIEAGDGALLDLFRTRPILQRVPQDQRLTDFIAEFLRQARESRIPQDEPQQKNESSEILLVPDSPAEVVENPT